MERFKRTEPFFGKSGMEKLFSSRVAVFGIGGVGGYAVEALARSGIGTLDLIDNDKVCLSNLNRQIIATEKTIGCFKTESAKQRILDINPHAVVNTYETFVTDENIDKFDFHSYDYVIDAVDTVKTKLALICKCHKLNVPIISCMGAGNKSDPTQFEIADIYSTSVCPLARVIRTELRNLGIPKLKVVYSKEPPLKPNASTMESRYSGRPSPASNAFTPSVAGLIAASEVIKSLAKN